MGADRRRRGHQGRLQDAQHLDRVFKKLDTIKKDVVWWTTGAQLPRLLADGQVTAYKDRIYDAVNNSGKHFEIMWDAAVMAFNLWAIPKGGPRLDNAYKFVAFAASAQAQADLTRYIAYSPANSDEMALVDPAILPHLPTAPDHMGIAADPAFWADKGNDPRERFTAWFAK